MFIGQASNMLCFLLNKSTQKKEDDQMCPNGYWLFLIFFSETTWQIGIKDGWNVHYVVFYE